EDIILTTIINRDIMTGAGLNAIPAQEKIIISIAIIEVIEMVGMQVIISAEDIILTTIINRDIMTGAGLNAIRVQEKIIISIATIEVTEMVGIADIINV
ncbi:MAG: hypothetical protein P794_09895, partial [Epsilonproteobacteria bacterium (ex Lamellibrachia satsuma)]